MLHYQKISDIEQDTKAAITAWMNENLSPYVEWSLERMTCNKYKLIDYTGAIAYLVYDINYRFVYMMDA